VNINLFLNMRDMRAELAECKVQTSGGAVNGSGVAGQGLRVTGEPVSSQNFAAVSGLVASGTLACVRVTDAILMVRSGHIRL
jgi:hypothetical protein